jgi:predicted Zn-dependent protease
VAGRIAAAVVALIMLACGVVWERDVRLQARAVPESHHHDTLAQAAKHLRAARLLNPDGTLEVSLAAVYRTAGDEARGRQTLEALLRREPDNLLAWGLLYAIAQRSDPAAAQRAVAARKRLDPLNARKAR